MAERIFHEIGSICDAGLGDGLNGKVSEAIKALPEKCSFIGASMRKAISEMKQVMLIVPGGILTSQE